jgi:hypothetical protein
MATKKFPLPADSGQQMPIEQGFGRFVEPTPNEEPVEVELDELDEATASDSANMVELEDGSVEISLEEEEEYKVSPEEQKKFLVNLADGGIPEEDLSAMSLRLREAVEQDKEDRKGRDTQYTEGIKRTGLGKESPGGAAFSGASEVVHPMLVEGCIDFAARAMKELFPPKGPVRSQIIGEATTEKTEKAERKKQYMNWQLTKQVKEYREEQEQMLTQVPLGGSQYMKVWRSEIKERICVEFLPIDNLFLPYAAGGLDSSERKTHRQFLTKHELEQRVESGLYRDVSGISSTSISPDKSDAEVATEKIEGKEASGLNEDGESEIYEIYTDWKFKQDKLAEGKYAPYIITIDAITGKTLSVYRNWAPKDEKREELAWIVEFGFIPWRGAYKLGLAHIIGSLSAGATGAIRALLDSAHINNLPGLVKLKGNRMAGQEVTIDPTAITEIEGPTQIDDIRKVLMATPFNPPSTVLFTLLEWMTGVGKGIVSTADEKIADMSSNSPVGTTLAMIEQGSVTYSSIHSRLHASQAKVLAIFHRLNAIYLKDEETVEELGELIVRRDDFEGPMDVIPVSDPNIFSDTQRYAQNAEAGKLVVAFPQAFKLDRYIERSLQLLNYPEYSEILNAPMEAKEMDAIDENYQATKQETQIKAYEGQDHVAHLKVHLMFALSPVMCNNPMMAMPAMPALMNHVKEHLLMLYVQHARAAASAAELLNRAAGPGEEAAVVEGNMSSEAHLVQQVGPLMEQIQALFQATQQFSPKPPVDPSVQKTQMELGYKEKKDAADVQAAQNEQMQTLQAKNAELQAKMQAETEKRQAENTRHTEEMAVSNRNAEMAMDAERQKNELNARLTALKEDAATERAQFQAMFATQMESLKAENAARLAVLNDALAETQTTAQNQATQMQTVLQAVLERMASEDQMEHERATMSMKEGGEVKPIVKMKKKWKVVRKNGEMDLIEEL